MKVVLEMVPTDVAVRSVVEPLALPMKVFNENWKKLDVQHQKSHIKHAMYSARTMLAKHSEINKAPAMLGTPSPELVSDIKFQQAELFHILSGEMLAQASLQAEILVCTVANVPHSKYIGRSQYPRIENKPARRKHALDDKFTCPAANY